MTTKKLLTGVAFAALVAGAATAQDNVTVTTAGNGEFTSGMDFSAEHDGAIGAIAEFTHDADNADYDLLGVAAVVDITFTFTGGLVLGEIADDADFTEGADTDCSFTVVAGGGIGSTSVTYRNDGTDFRTCSNNTSFEFDLTRSAANASQDSGATVGVACTADCGTFTDESDTFTLIDDTSSFPAADQVVTATAITLDNDGIGPVGPHTIGNVSYDFDNLGTINVDGNGVTMGGLALGAVGDHVASASLVIDFPGGDDGIAAVTVDVTAGASACTEDAGAAVTTWTCPLTAAELDQLEANGDVEITSDNATAIAQQTPTASLTVTATAGNATPPALSGPLGAIGWDDGLNTDVPNGGGAGADFEWVNVRSSGGTDNAFRVTGLPTDLSETGACIEVQAGNTNTTIANAGWNCITGASVVASADMTWTATFRSSDLNAALGAGEGNADLQFRVRRDDAEGADGANNGTIDIRRLLAKGGVVTGTGFDQ